MDRYGTPHVMLTEINTRYGAVIAASHRSKTVLTVSKMRHTVSTRWHPSTSKCGKSRQMRRHGAIWIGVGHPI